MDDTSTPDETPEKSNEAHEGYEGYETAEDDEDLLLDPDDMCTEFHIADDAADFEVDRADFKPDTYLRVIEGAVDQLAGMFRDEDATIQAPRLLLETKNGTVIIEDDPDPPEENDGGICIRVEREDDAGEHVCYVGGCQQRFDSLEAVEDHIRETANTSDDTKKRHAMTAAFLPESDDD